MEHLADGTLSNTDNVIDVTTGTLKLRAQFDNSDGALFPNQFVNAQLLVRTLTNVVTVPTVAIQRGSPNGQQGSFVYVVNADNTVSVRPITIGPTDGSVTAVNTGLAAGDHVVIDGADRLREGLHVNVSTLDGKPPGGADAPAAGPQGRRGGQNPNGERSQNRRNNSQ